MMHMMIIPAYDDHKVSSHLFWFSVTLEYVNIGIDVIHFQPVIQAQRSVCTRPVKNTTKLKKKRNGLEANILRGIG
jgi:hypothetical protein